MKWLQSVLRMAEGTGGGGGGGQGDQSQGGGGGGGNILQRAGAGAADAGAGGGGGGPGDQGGQGGQGGGGGGSNQPPAFAWRDVIGDDGNFKSDWTAGLPDELKPAAETLKNYKNPTELMRGLHSTKVLLGQKGNGVVIPDATSKPEVVAAYRKAVGAPETPEAYELKRPADLPKEIPFDEEGAKQFAALFHKHHVPKAVAQELQAALIAQQKADHVKLVAEEEKYVADAVTGLRAKWGDQFEGNMAKAFAMVKHGGIPEDHDALKHPEVIEMLVKFHNIIKSEDGIVRGQITGGVDPEVEATRIQTDSTHPMYALYQKGDPAAVQMVRQLLQRVPPKK